jgi:hypothetical protein
MYDLPIQVSPAQTEAKEILAHLLSKLQDPECIYHARYGAWVSRNPRLDDFISRCVRPSVWTFLRGRWSLDALKAVGGDLRFEGRAVYFDGVLGLDRRMRMYIGQTTFLRQRVAQHLNFRYRRDNPSLHYYALENSTYNTIGAVASIPSPHAGNQGLPGMDAPDLLLNVLEMWVCLVFRSLPDAVLEEWVPEHEAVSKGRKEGKEGVYWGLNVACPLDNGGERRFVDLSESQDPLVQEYLKQGRPREQPREQLREQEREQQKVEVVKKEIVKQDPVKTPHQHLRKISEEVDSPEERKIAYAEKARNYNVRAQTDILVPQWVAYGTAAVLVGLLALNVRSGLQSRR